MNNMLVIFLCLGVSLAQDNFIGYGERNPASLQLDSYRERQAIPLNYTTSYGFPVSNIHSSLSVGRGGPLLLQDTILLESLQHLNRERIPERVVHAKGAGAFGYFEVINDISRYTRARLFSQAGLRTPVAVRFSQALGRLGSPDTVRDIRGFAVKFYTEEGNFDIPGLIIPIFPVSDPFRFIDILHSNKLNPVTNLPDPTMFWDSVANTPEIMHYTLHYYSDVAIPASFRAMNGYSISTFRLVNSNHESVFCRFNFKTNQIRPGMDPQRAVHLAGTDPDYFVRDLYNSIASNNFPSWNFTIQIMTDEEARNFRWNPFDPTKSWPEQLVPVITVGRLVLNRNPRNYFTDIEQLAFSPSRLVPGVEPSLETVLQARFYAYSDTQSYRLGINNQLLPVNAPRVTVANRQRDGFDTYGDNQGGEPNYYPNSFNGPQPNPLYSSYNYSVSGFVGRYEQNDFYSQASDTWNLFSEDERSRIVRNIVADLRLTSPEIQNRVLQLFSNVNTTLSNAISQAIGS